MKRLFDAIIARLVYWITPKPEPVEEDEDTDDCCQCSHDRCHHASGKYRCAVCNPPFSEDNDTSEWTRCACQFFVKRNDNDDDSDDPVTPSPKELEDLYSK